MESQPQNPEFRINPENFHPCYYTFQRVNNKGADQTVDAQDGLLVYFHATKSVFLAMWAHIIMLLSLQFGCKKIFSLHCS